nr:uncharacterized mitochondrial protein AtMg00810-like [Tanacetum cinerariifolium]
KSASTPIDAEKPLLKDSDGEDVDVHTYRSMIGSLMYLTSSRPDIIFAVCACARFQVTPKVSHLNAVKRIFRYLKGKPYLGLWYPKDLPFDLVAYSDGDYAGASLDKKSTIGECQFLGCRLISWQCKKQTVVATSSTEVEYVAAASGCAQVLWIQNQLLDYGDSPLLGVNTPRSDEDRLKLMELMVFLLQKDVWVEIGITATRLSSYCCQANFWNSVSVKRSGDVTRLQALVDKKNIVISEVVIREILQLNDAEGVICLPNEEIFAGLAQMGYEKPSTKLTFYKAFFSMICLSKGQRFNFSKYIFDSLVRNVDSSSKFYMYPRFIQLIIQAQVADLSTYTTRFISPDLTQKVFDNMRRVGKGFSGVETPLFEGMIADRQPAEEELRAEHVQVDVAVAAAVVEDVVEDVAEDVAHVATPSPPPHGIPSPPQEPSSPPQQPHVTPPTPTHEHDNVSQRLEIVKLKARVKKLEQTDKVKSSKLRRLRKVGASRQVESSDDMEDVFNQERMNEDEWIELVKDAEIAESEGRQADKQAKIYNIDLDHSSKVLIVAAYTRRRKGVIIRDPEEELSLKTSETPAETLKVKDKDKGTMVETPKPMKKKDQIEMDAEYARKLQEEIDRDHDRFNKDVDWDAAIDNVNQKSSSNPQYIKRYQGMKKIPQTESEARKNMMIYLKNTAGYKIDFFKGMTYAQICPIFQARFDENIRFPFKSIEEMEEEDQEIIKSINETPAQKAAKRRKLNEEAQEAEDLRKQLEVVEDEDDDVFVEATPLASKVPIVDYQIVLIDNKPRSREFMENSERQISTSKPTNFSDEYLLLTLKTMFEEPDGQDAIWRNQKSVHGLALVKRWKLLTLCGVHIITLSTVQLFLLVERRYPLSRFTLEQLVNVARLQVKEETVVKRSGDVTRLQALVDKKRIVISEEVVREILQLDEAEGVICLPNDEIFAGLARQRFNFSKYIFESLVRNVDSTSKFYMYPRVGKGFSGVETPLFENMLAVRADDAEEEVQGDRAMDVTTPDRAVTAQ